MELMVVVLVLALVVVDTLELDDVAGLVVVVAGVDVVADMTLY